MRQAPSRYRLCVVPAAICCFVLLAATPSEAGRLVRSSGQHVKGGHGLTHVGAGRFRHGHLKAKRFDRRRARPDVVRRADRKRRPYYGTRYSYGYGWSYPYRDATRSESRYRPETNVARQPYEDRPVTPKWVHVGGGLASFADEGPVAGDGLGTNCLSVKTDITVDGTPMEAFGEACLLADGTWQLKPTQDTE